ncbi:MAG: hypothetical protein RML94_16485, partial [Bacteroidia bacterium]|nr:hypothetical protein [Bacteroidia bacterium]
MSHLQVESATFFLGFSITVDCVFFSYAQSSLTVTVNVTHASVCTPPCNGMATAYVTGGTPPYYFIWSTN